MATTPTVGAHYYLADAATPAVMRYLGHLKNSTSQGVLVAGDDYAIADWDNLVRVPTSKTDLVSWLRNADKALEAGDTEGARALLASVQQWALGMAKVEG